MNITFFIGNGFDINIGMETSYKAFYPYFIEKASDDNLIKTWLMEDDLLWADLEERLGHELIQLEESEAAKEKFLNDKAELNELLAEYLEREQKKIYTKGKEDEVAEELVRSLKDFSMILPEEEREDISKICGKYAQEDVKYQFICFNYTNVLDQIITITRTTRKRITTHKYRRNERNNLLGTVTYIHGTTDTEMILAVNDPDQINNSFLKNDEEFLDTFIKRRMNASIAERKTEHVKAIIDASHIICVFGMSMGATDKMWWEELVKWLKESEDNRLVIYYKGYENELKRRFPERIIPLKNRLKKKILALGEMSPDNPDYGRVSDSIFIKFNSDIFNFRFLTKEEPDNV